MDKQEERIVIVADGKYSGTWTAKNSKIMQGSEMEWKLSRQISARITLWKRFPVGNSVASSFSAPK